MNKTNNGYNGAYQSFPFPNQRVSDKEKDKPEWYAACCDWIIAQGQNIRDSDELDRKYNILKGEIPDDFYRKTLNPYNSTNKKYTRFPATMRNYDMIKGIVRRYVSEYIKNPHDFIVSACNPEVVLARNVKLQQELAMVVEQKLAAKITESYNQYLNEGGDPQQFNHGEAINIEQFIQDFNEKFVDDVSAQGQDILNVIQRMTDDALLYARVYFDFVTFGEAYTFTDVVGNKLIKRNVAPRDAFPIPNDNMFAEDFDMFAERMKMTHQQIIDNYDEYLDNKQREFLNTYYAKNSISTPTANFFDTYQDYFPDVCNKFSNEDRAFFKKQPIMMRDVNNDLYDVWHVVWRGEKRKAVVTYVNDINIVTQRIENDDYKLDIENGEIKIEYFYEPQVYESIRIGTRNDAIYPYGARAIAFNREGKLPYNGLCELLPGFGKFSIIDEVIPYQVFYNIVAYHREMIIAKNKLSVLMIAKSLLGKVPEDTIYKMLADGVLYVDDSDDQGMLKAQQVRMLNATSGEYISQLTALLASIEESAKNQVDMTPQRYGAIANSAGKGVTEEAIIRGSMGSVVIEWIVDNMRERDYARDMDYTKLAWVDGLNTTLKDSDDSLKYISLDIDKHLYSDYLVYAKNSAKEMDKLEQLKNYAFSAAQNGQDEIAIAAIMGDNVASIKKLITQFKEVERQHESDMQAMEQQTEQARQEFELQKIAAKGEQDRLTKELESYLDQEIALIQADANLMSYDNGATSEQMSAANQRLQDSRNSVERDKLRVQQQANMLDAFNKHEDRKLKDKDINTKLKIATTNKNRYDFKGKAKDK